MASNHLEILLLSAFLFFVLLGFILYHSKLGKNNLLLQISLAENELLHKKDLLLEQNKSLEDKQLLIDSLQLQTNKLTTRLRESEVRLQSFQERLADQKNTEAKLSDQFEVLSQKIFNDKATQFKELNNESIAKLLDPLKIQLDGFKQQVSDCYLNETKERYNLKSEINKLAYLNETMQVETKNLTNALKGDNKQQGNWGEVLLQKILEESGLRKGHEYETQVSLKNEEGKRMQPDILVHLPKQRNIIIDSKVSLVAYERYFNAEDKVARDEAIAAHTLSLRQHIKGLGKKDYHQLKGVNSLDHVLLFVAIEPAFITAIEHDPSLIKLALDHNVMLASPTNLMIALRTIENLWRFENQEQNGLLIAKQAAKLYDKLRLFSENMLEVGISLDRAKISYDHALKQMSSGRGNIIAQTEQLKQMGVPVKKSISNKLLEQV